jgi:hypothetical protein
LSHSFDLFFFSFFAPFRAFGKVQSAVKPKLFKPFRLV